MDLLDLPQTFSLSQALLALGAVAGVAFLDQYRRSRGAKVSLQRGCLLGSLLALFLIGLSGSFMGREAMNNPYMLGLVFILLVVGWKLLFGPWTREAKTAALGAFLFWVTFSVLSQQDPATRNVQLFSMVLALIPAAVWCALFLRYHMERMSAVLLMFFSGMLSTVPILFYDRLVRSGVEFQFFLFRVTPESFSETSHGFVAGQLASGRGVQSLVMTTLVSFLIVGIIEELSKGWVFTHSGRSIVRSIDDAIELSIIVAIGFAFAENIVNPAYFGGFVRQYLLSADPNIMAFLGNALGRSVLTSMVHILSTGVLGYFLGVALFADPYLAERKAQGKNYAFLRRLRTIIPLREVDLFRIIMVATGIVTAVVLHAAFNFMVTLPDLLPGNPQTVGELFGIGWPIIAQVPLLLLPCLLYVVGGFWLLTSLFMGKENEEDRGHVQVEEVFVRD